MDSATALAMADGYISSVQPIQTFMLRLGMVIVPLAAMIAAYIIIKKKYKIDENEYSRLVQEISKKK